MLFEQSCSQCGEKCKRNSSSIPDHSAGCQHLQASPESLGRRFCLGCIGPDVRIVWVNKQRDRAGRREQLTQKLQTLWPENTDQGGHPCEVTARSVEAVNEACLDWIGTGHEYNRDGFGCHLRRKRCWGIEGGDHGQH